MRQELINDMKMFLEMVGGFKDSIRTELEGIEPLCIRCHKQEKPNEMTIESYVRCGCCDQSYHKQCYQQHKKQRKEAQEKPLNRHEKRFMEIYLIKIKQVERTKNQEPNREEVVEALMPQSQGCPNCQKDTCRCIFLYDIIRKKKKTKKA